MKHVFTSLYAVKPKSDIRKCLHIYIITKQIFNILLFGNNQITTFEHYFQNILSFIEILKKLIKILQALNNIMNIKIIIDDFG